MAKKKTAPVRSAEPESVLDTDPQSRNEAILMRTLGKSVTVRDPQSRIEELLIDLGDKIDASTLPSVTSSDNGKVAKVVNGAWAAAQAGGGVTETTYAALKSARDGGTLQPGTLYRITDYETIINGTYDLTAIAGQTAYLHYARSAGHAFDLIVMAIDESTLDEHAIATSHAGDDYFDDCSLEAWDIKYTIENDSTKYAWADETNGKGVIFSMEDEFGNRAGYDFKNIQFLAYALAVKDSGTQSLDDYRLAYNPNGDDTTDNPYQPNRYGSVQNVFNALSSYLSSGTYTSPYKDYDFAVSQLILTSIGYPTVDDNYLTTFGAEWYYTFSFLNNGTIIDASLNRLGDNQVHVLDNEIDYCTDSLATFLSSNIPGLGVPMGLNVSLWEHYLSLDSSENTDVVWICSNKLQQGCYGNIFGRYCAGNEFDSYCYSNTFGDSCYSNTFGNSCNSNTFGNYCHSNTFGNYCHSNTFGNYCYSNTFGDSCYSNTFGNSCNSNTFGDMNDNNELQGYIHYAKFGDYVGYVELGGGQDGNPVEYYHVCDNVQGSANNRIAITGDYTKTVETYVGYNSNGVLKTWCPADLAT